ncbi:MAG: prepilin-type N-terminal cleavage/methylation domain-containing protein [Actinomycetes bacterium]
MMRRARWMSPERRRDDGFTLIELLVVIIIIGILCAIAIPIFLNQRHRAIDASIQSDLRNVANQMESYYSDFSMYPTTLAGTTFAGYTVLGNELLRVSTGNVILVNFNAAADAYCLQGTNPQGTDATGWFYVSDTGGLQPKGTGSCGTY